MTATLFVLLVASTSFAIVVLTARYLRQSDWMVGAIGLAFWLIYVGAISYSGLLSPGVDRPPGILLVILPPIAFIIFVLIRSAVGQRIASTIPLAVLMLFQIYRIGVELLLHRLWIDGLVPRMLTFAGANVDVYIGLTAPIAAWMATVGRRGLQIALAWNFLGLAALTNVIVRSFLTAPGPLHLLTDDVPNSAIALFPYGYLPGFLAPLAVALHILAIRAIVQRLASQTLLGTSSALSANKGSST